MEFRPRRRPRPKNTERITRAALLSLGLSYAWLSELTGIPAAELPRRLRPDRLKAYEWIALCDALHMDPDGLSFGYCRRTHEARVRRALEDGYFRLPKTWAFWRLYGKIWRDRCASWHFYGKYYGFRLRWKVRFQEIGKAIQRSWKPEHADYYPQGPARLAFRGLNPDFSRPGLRTELPRKRGNRESQADLGQI